MMKTTTFKKCENCGKEFYGPKWKIKIQKYCSKECSYCAKHIYKICPECGKVFRAKTASVLCSRSCRNKYYAKPCTEEHKKKTSDSMKGKNAGPNNFWYGKYGELNPNWKGGISQEPYPFKFNKRLKKRIRERDNYTCFICQKHGKHVHHIDYDKQNCDHDNLITLCNSCHAKTNFNRKAWIKFFKSALLLNGVRK